MNFHSVGKKIHMKDDSEVQYRVVLVQNNKYVVERLYIESVGLLWKRKYEIWQAVNQFGFARTYTVPEYYNTEKQARDAITRFLRGKVILPDPDDGE